MITSATTTRITVAVFLSKPVFAASVDASGIASFLKLTVINWAGESDLWSLVTSSARNVWLPYVTFEIV